MSFGIAKDIKSEVRVCTPELLNEALDSPQVAKVCAMIEDALEAVRRGEMTNPDFETMKGQLKKRLPILTPHATFKNGRRKNADAIPSGLSMYDKDHIPNPREWWESIEDRKTALGIVFAHITPSTEGCRLFFFIPPGMNLAEAQAWMAQQLGDTEYDVCVKDYARSSFIVPREYVLFIDEEKLFSVQMIEQMIDERGEMIGQMIDDKGEMIEKNNYHLSTINYHLKEDSHLKEESYPETFEEISYKDIVETLEEQMGEHPNTVAATTSSSRWRAI